MKFLGKLKNDKSLSPDGTHLRVLKELRCEIANLLTYICIKSLNSAIVPEECNKFFKRDPEGNWEIIGQAT